VAPLNDLRELMLCYPQLAQRLVEQTSRELAASLALSGGYSAEQRVAAFLIQMHERLDDGALLRLPMAQRDIGNYLRLATETVCRTLKNLERRRLVALEGRNVRILDEAALLDIAEPVGIAQPA
jgi:CRP/FNR family transcriptional regulator